jgi:hypothetical protein
MAATEGQLAEPLLQHLTGPQAACLAVIGGVVQRCEAWPVFQYVEAQLDKQGQAPDALSVIRSLPVMTHGPFSYGLVRSQGGFRPDERVELTVAGAYRFAPADQLATLYLRILAGIAEAAAGAEYDPLTVTDVQVDGAELVARLGLAEHPFLSLLPDLVMHEPGTTHGAQPGGSASQWSHRPSSFIRRFRGVADVPDYLARVRAWQVPADLTPAPTTGLSQPCLEGPVRHAAGHTAQRRADHPAGVRRIHRGGVRQPPECPARGFEGPCCARAVRRGRPDPRLPEGQAARRPGSRAADQAGRGHPAAVKHARDAAQHVQARSQAAREWPRLGLSYPITDYAQAWRSVTAYVIDALRVLREELESSP